MRRREILVCNEALGFKTYPTETAARPQTGNFLTFLTNVWPRDWRSGSFWTVLGTMLTILALIWGFGCDPRRWVVMGACRNPPWRDLPRGLEMAATLNTMASNPPTLQQRRRRGFLFSSSILSKQNRRLLLRQDRCLLLRQDKCLLLGQDKCFLGQGSCLFVSRTRHCHVSLFHFLPNSCSNPGRWISPEHRKYGPQGLCKTPRPIFQWVLRHSMNPELSASPEKFVLPQQKTFDFPENICLVPTTNSCPV